MSDISNKSLKLEEEDLQNKIPFDNNNDDDAAISEEKKQANKLINDKELEERNNWSKNENQYNYLLSYKHILME